MTQELPLNPTHRRAGATLHPWQDWIVPWRFSQPGMEYHAAKRGAGLIDWSMWDAIDVAGSDRVAFLHNLLSNDIKGLRPGTGCPAGLLNPNAKLLADLMVLADSTVHRLLCPRARTRIILDTFDRHHITEDVTFSRHDQIACLALQGPDIPTLLQRLGLSLHSWQPGVYQQASLAGIPAHGLVHELLGEPGMLLLAPAAQAEALWQLLTSQAKPHAVPVGWEVFNVLRIEAGLPWFGVDMDETTLLPETGLEGRLASSTKGCYVGQEVMARLETYGSVSRKLRGFICEGQVLPEQGEAIVKDGQTIGEITSSCFSLGLMCPIALGYLKRPFYETEAEVQIVHGNDRLRARVSGLPFAVPSIARPDV